MKYWGYLVAKLSVASAFWVALCLAVLRSLPEQQPFLTVVDPAAIGGKKAVYVPDLASTFAMLGLALIAVGLAWIVLWDQRRRCRTCLRRLRMPILQGSWTHVLFGRPRTEYICTYGHGTLTVEELQLTGTQESDWQPHEDIWKELMSLDDSKK